MPRSLGKKQSTIFVISNLLAILARKFYQHQKRKLTEPMRHLPKEGWKNQFPIVLVHGLGGGAPDQGHLVGVYFHYALMQEVSSDQEVYLAVMTPMGCVHDRACELYQQLVGINQVRIDNCLRDQEFGAPLAKAVYGPQHFHEEHPNQIFYKPRTLRKILNGQVLGYPDGVPGGWNEENRIHFITHSMGAQTVRYLQYLLSIDYFSQNMSIGQKVPININIGNRPNYDYRQKDIQNEDKSKYIASITSINGMMNGGTGPHAPDLDPITNKYEFYGNKGLGGTWISHLWKRANQVMSIMDNFRTPHLTSNRLSDNVSQTIRVEGDPIQKLETQNHLYMMDLYPEIWGLNRRHNESVLDYIRRVMSDTCVRDTYCLGMQENTPGYMTKMNEFVKTFDHTYYFSVVGGERKKQREKQREVLKEPFKMTNSALNFVSDVTSNIEFTGTLDQIKRRNSKSPITLIEQIWIHFKLLTNPLNMNTKLHADNHWGKDLLVSHFSNIKNQKMNNVLSVDYAIRDWCDDTDLMLPRLCQEFPRVSNGLQMKNQEGPWGDKHPQYVNMEMENPKFEKGRWYYSSFSQTDHHDFAGMPNIWRRIQILLGIDYRPGIYIKLFNRLRMLDYTEPKKGSKISNDGVFQTPSTMAEETLSSGLSAKSSEEENII